jgi:hypothetical protein
MHACAFPHIIARGDPLLSNRAEDGDPDRSMNILWIAVGIAIVGALTTRVIWTRQLRESQLGFVSEHWLAEHWLSYVSDP